jgi:hypothetical protein
MSEARIRTAFVRPGLVGASFALSGLASCLTMVVAVKSGGEVLAFIGVELVLFLSGAWAASSLRIGRLARAGVGLAIAVGTTCSFPPFIATQAMKGNEKVGELLLVFAAWFVTAYFIGSAVGLLPMLTNWEKVYAMGLLGFCGGAAISALLVAFMIVNNVLNLFTMLSLIPIPGIVGGVSLAWALNSVRRKQTAGEP